MSPKSQALKEQVIAIGAWSVCLPALAFWPFLSAFPIFALVGETETARIIPNLLFLLTGFWPALAVFLVIRFVTGGMRASAQPAPWRKGGLAVGAYATVWTALYGVFALT
jgi:hypothetical protein